MVEDISKLDELFRALANGTRRELLARLVGHDATVSELAEPLAMTLAATSKHIKVLERAGLVHQTVVGRQHVCRLDPSRLAPASEWLLFHERQRKPLDPLEALISADPLGREDR